MALPFDLIFAGSFAYAGYRTLGRWLKFNEDNAKHKGGAFPLNDEGSFTYETLHSSRGQLRCLRKRLIGYCSSCHRRCRC